MLAKTLLKLMSRNNLKLYLMSKGKRLTKTINLIDKRGISTLGGMQDSHRKQMQM
jgi:hypothetical protein